MVELSDRVNPGCKCQNCPLRQWQFPIGSPLENPPQALDLELGKGLAGVFRGLADINQRKREEILYKKFLKITNLLALTSAITLPIGLIVENFFTEWALAFSHCLIGGSIAILGGWLFTRALLYCPMLSDKIIARKMKKKK